MSYVIGKRLTAYPPVYRPDAGATKPFITGGLAKVASVLTANTGNSPWVGQGTMVPTYQWLLNGALAYASATVASYSCSAADSTKVLGCRVGFGNATWGTGVYDCFTGTVAP